MAVVIGALRLVSNQYGRCQLVSSGASWCRLLESLFWFRSLITGLFLSFVCFRPRQRLLDIGSAWNGHRWRLVGLVWSESSMSMWLSDGILSLVRGFFLHFLTRDRKKKIKCDSGSREFGNFFGNFVFTPDTTNMWLLRRETQSGRYLCSKIEKS